MANAIAMIRRCAEHQNSNLPVGPIEGTTSRESYRYTPEYVAPSDRGRDDVRHFVEGSDPLGCPAVDA